jgi:hypothetical protein
MGIPPEILSGPAGNNPDQESCRAGCVEQEGAKGGCRTCLPGDQQHADNNKKTMV